MNWPTTRPFKTHLLLLAAAAVVPVLLVVGVHVARPDAPPPIPANAQGESTTTTPTPTPTPAPTSIDPTAAQQAAAAGVTAWQIDDKVDRSRELLHTVTPQFAELISIVPADMVPDSPPTSIGDAVLNGPTTALVPVTLGDGTGLVVTVVRDGTHLLVSGIEQAEGE